METAGAEALSVFPSENPSRHIRISTAKKVCWDFILCVMHDGSQVPHCLPGSLGQNKARRHSSFSQDAVWQVPNHIP